MRLAALAIFGSTTLISLIFTGLVRQQNAPEPFTLAPFEGDLCVVVDVTVNGQGPFKFLLDTGAALCSISTELAERLDIKATHAGRFFGFEDCQSTCPIGRVESLAIGGASRVKSEVAIMTVDLRGDADAPPIDGILGDNFLRGYRISIDYPARTIQFARSGKY